MLLRQQRLLIHHNAGTLRVAALRCSSALHHDHTTTTTTTKYQYLSLYNYTDLAARELPPLRKRLTERWSALDVLGRIYIAQEGINAQLILPAANVDAFVDSFPQLFARDQLNYGAVYEYDAHEAAARVRQLFEKLDIRIRNQIVADGFHNGHLDLSDSGAALPPDQWHRKLQQRNANANANADVDAGTNTNANANADTTTLVLDVRNFYEHEIGRFDGATRIMVDTFRDTFDAVDEILEHHKAAHDGQPPHEVMMYCTGGIRCEKVGAYLKQHKGIDAIHKLQGGIVKYQQFLKAHPEEQSLFKGKNFVFDQRCVVGVDDQGRRLSAEDVTADVLGKCFQCGVPCNVHTNCSNGMCGGLILQCASCRVESYGACSPACKEQAIILNSMDSVEARKGYRKRHAYKWVPMVPNAITRTRQRTRAYCTSSTDQKPPLLDLNAYAQSSSSPLPDHELLRELRRATEAHWPKSEQLIDEPHGKALRFLVQLTGAKDVLEVGCFTGYSALCLASGLVSAQGCVTTCDINTETSAFARSFFDRSSSAKRIHTVVSDGMDYLEQCAATGKAFDLIFVDANKRQYLNYYNAILEKRLLRSNGLLVFDNTLFRGRVLASANGEAHKKERIAHGLAEFNDYISKDERTVCLLLPVWDGLTLVRQR